MGLDMYLKGQKYFWTTWEEQSVDRTEDNYKIKQVELELGYWRKEPNLHGFIVKEFGGGVDKCQQISLSIDQMRVLVEAVRKNELPMTTGFFFGRSYDPNIQAEKEHHERFVKYTVEVLEKAVAWAEVKDEGKQHISREVIYQASW